MSPETAASWLDAPTALTKDLILESVGFTYAQASAERRVRELLGAAKPAGFPKNENWAVGIEVKHPPKAMELASFGVSAGYTSADMLAAKKKQ